MSRIVPRNQGIFNNIENLIEQMCRRPCAPGMTYQGDAGRMSVFKRLRNVRSDEGVSTVDADVFNEERKMARAKRFSQTTNLGNNGRSRNSSIRFVSFHAFFSF